jgi:hypothetical protein
MQPPPSPGRPDQRQDGGLDVIGERRPGINHAGQVGVGGLVCYPRRKLWRKRGEEFVGMPCGFKS